MWYGAFHYIQSFSVLLITVFQTVLAMFIILAIGADDIFVIVDTWQQYRTAAPEERMAKRMTATLKHAGKVMATTSASTCFSFIGNTTSSFPAVYTFGAFAGIYSVVDSESESDSESASLILSLSTNLYLFY